MKSLLPFLVIGVATGSVYALAAMGLVVTYTTSGVFNFAHGAVGMASTFVFYSLRVDAGVPTLLAAVIAIGIVGPALGVIIDRLLFRRLTGAPTSTYVVVSLGVLVLLQGVATVVYGRAPRTVAPLFPTSTFTVAGMNIGWDQVSLTLIAGVTGLVLIAFFRWSHLGLQMRAVINDRDLTALVGADPSRITTAAWMLGSAFASMSGVLLAPVLGVDSVLLTLLVIQAFGAAAVGRLASLPMTYFGGIAIGVGAALSTRYIAHHPLLAGVPTSLPFIVLFLVLVLSPKGSFTELTKIGERVATRSVGGRRRFPLSTLAVLTGAAAVLPLFLSDVRIVTATSTVAYVLVFASLGLLVGLSRQVSLCHAVFVVFGATNLAHLTAAGVPWLLALVLAGVLLVPVGALLAIPAIRLSGLFLALATFGFGVLAQNLLFGTDFVFGRRATVALHRPPLVAGDRAYYYVVLAIVVAGIVAIEAVRVTRLGRLLQGLADSPTAVESLGINPTSSRVITFCLTALLAAVAGGLLGTLTGGVSPATFDASQSLLWVTVLVAAGAATLGGAVTAAVLMVTVPALITSATLLEYLPIAFGLAAILQAQTPNGLATMYRRPDFSRRATATAWRRASSRHQDRMRLVLGHE